MNVSVLVNWHYQNMRRVGFDVMKCKDCEYLSHGKSSTTSRDTFSCTHAEAFGDEKPWSGERLIAHAIDKHSSELPIKTAPRWCPLKRQL